MKINKLGNLEDHSYYVIDKTEEAVNTLSMLVERLFLVRFNFVDKMKDDSGKIIETSRSFEKTYDLFEVLAGKIRIEVFYGKDKMLLNLFGSKEERKKFNNALKEIAGLPLAKFIEGEI